MSWPDRIENNVFTIRTGDGKLFYPLWKNSETSKEFNTTVFDFIDRAGSLVDRRKPKGRRFPLTFWFQGDDNIEQSETFDRSANDPRAWVVSHPFYGVINGQPIGISRNDQNYNVTEINVDFYESINLKGPVVEVATADVINTFVFKYREQSPADYASKVLLKPTDVVQTRDLATKINGLIAKTLTTVAYPEFILLRNIMFKSVDNLILAPVQGIQSIHDVILAPSRFLVSVGSRISLIGAIYNSAANILQTSPTKNNKALFETVAGIAIGALSIAITNPLPKDYQTRGDVISATNNLVDMYNDYLMQLDAAYVSITDSANAFTASQQTQNDLQNIVLTALSSLATLAFNAKQERRVILDRDSNLIPLTHRYMGLDVDDENLETFRVINNIKNNSLFLIAKGTEIIYYV